MQDTNKKTIEDISVNGKKCLVRCDFNVPIKDGIITDDKRIREALKTIRYLVNNDAKVILCSHLGRPKGTFNATYSLKPVAVRLSELLGQKVEMAEDVVGKDAKAKSSSLTEGQILLLENLRFDPREEKNDPGFAKELASLAEVYVNDAFGTAHRSHASTEGVTHYLQPAVCGYLIQKEIDIMGKALSNPKKPFVAILGGAKVSDKIGVIENLLDEADRFLIGGGMAYTFLHAKGYNIGNSLYEEDKIELAKSLLDKAKGKNINILLPSDVVIGDKFSDDCNAKTVDSNNIPNGWMGLDIGKKSISEFSDIIKNAGTIVWNGPMGVFEMQRFALGTKAIAKAVAESKAVSIIGGGDSAAAVEKLGYADKMTHISTGGGASLEFLAGKNLPAIAALTDK